MPTHIAAVADPCDTKDSPVFEIGPLKCTERGLARILEALKDRDIFISFQCYDLSLAQVAWACLHPAEARAWADESHRRANDGDPEPPFPKPED